MTESRQCPACGGVLVFSHEDDVYTKFYKCQQCGTTHSLRITREELASLTRQLKEARHNVEDKPKSPYPKCGGCAAFHTPFCSFAYTDEPDLKTFPTDHACTRYYAPLQKSTKSRKESFARKVQNL
jgi:ribosomal protein S27AE